MKRLLGPVAAGGASLTSLAFGCSGQPGLYPASSRVAAAAALSTVAAAAQRKIDAGSQIQ